MPDAKQDKRAHGHEISRREFIAVSASLAVAAGTGILGCGGGEPPVTVIRGPLLYAPTSTGISFNMVARGGREKLALELRRDGENGWTPGNRKLVETDVVEWHASDLAAGTRYEYRIMEHGPAVQAKELYTGGFSTTPGAGTSFTFDLISDSHIFVRDLTDEEIAEYPLVDTPPFQEQAQLAAFRREKAESIDTLVKVAGNVLSDAPDFMIHLGDLMDFHGFSHNPPSPAKMWTRKGYLDYRHHVGALACNTPHVFTLGNWDGENGWFTPEEIDRSRSQRFLYMPTPGPDTYPEGGGHNRDYYAFTWGDALIVVLNVMSYTPDDHPWQKIDTGADTWTLGADQLAWLENTLKQATATWKFMCIHHPVGGKAGNARESVYGRGGGHAARVGEQAIIHQWMREYGVQFLFYGHDHVFYDLVVDGIHYTLPGSAGAPDAWKFKSLGLGYRSHRMYKDSGHARVRVSPTGVTVEFVNENGEIINRLDVT